MDAAFTPGPWRTFTAMHSERVEIRAPNDETLDHPVVTVCEMGNWRGEFAAEMRANACLIAAAPDLLDALDAIVNYEAPFDFTKWNARIAAARAALAKARGKTEADANG